MKKSIVSLILLLTLSFPLFAKEIFRIESLGMECLLLGSMKEGPDGDSKKCLDLESNTIIWVADDKIGRQSDQLTAGEFFDKIVEVGLVFEVNESHPHWSATISENRLKIYTPLGIEAELEIKIDLNRDRLDGAFLLMFQSKDQQTYGVVRRLWFDTPCEIGIPDDERTIYEVFINHQGEVVKGCAILGQ